MKHVGGENTKIESVYRRYRSGTKITTGWVIRIQVADLNELAKLFGSIPEPGDEIEVPVRIDPAPLKPF